MDTDASVKEQIVEQAKGLLMQKKRMTEPEAHRYLQKQAMNRRIPKLVIAEGIIQQYISSSS